MKLLSLSREEESALSCGQLRDRFESLCDLQAIPEARTALDHALRAQELDLAFWIFESRKSSSVAREGAPCEPVLHLHFRTTAALEAETGLHPHKGNWEDTWTRTEALRDSANTILARHGLAQDFCSPQSFVFPRSWEQYCWNKIAYESEAAVETLVSKMVLGRWRDFVPGKRSYPSVYCGSAWEVLAPGAFNIVFEREEQLNRAKTLIDEIRAGCRYILRQGRHDGYVENFDVAIQLWWRGMAMPPLYRRD